MLGEIGEKVLEVGQVAIQLDELVEQVPLPRGTLASFLLLFANVGIELFVTGISTNQLQVGRSDSVKLDSTLPTFNEGATCITGAQSAGLSHHS